jgi:hypothetical protein
MHGSKKIEIQCQHLSTPNITVITETEENKADLYLVSGGSAVDEKQFLKKAFAGC